MWRGRNPDPTKQDVLRLSRVLFDSLHREDEAIEKTTDYDDPPTREKQEEKDTKRSEAADVDDDLTEVDDGDDEDEDEDEPEGEEKREDELDEDEDEDNDDDSVWGPYLIVILRIDTPQLYKDLVTCCTITKYGRKSLLAESWREGVGEEAQESRTRFGRYLWPQKILGGIFVNPAYSEDQAFAAAGLRLVGVPYHPRRIVLDLDNAVWQMHLLQHTAPNIYTYPEWERIRGYKFGFIFFLRSHVLTFNTHDQNTRVTWCTKKKWAAAKEWTPPNPVLDYFGWSDWTARYFRLYAPRRRTTLTIYQWLTQASRRHSMQGNGSYMTHELGANRFSIL
ncbi:hypothetical protein R3P38DRAFT_2794680 [Favolaschia claudopus]|uniref:Uncharacterized protein n=1 Tax=Favolaschia claudopus TaxID=2862362 RepID=A0AAW0A9U0_9AGAR